MDKEENLPKRIVRTITLTNDDLIHLDGGKNYVPHGSKNQN